VADEQKLDATFFAFKKRDKRFVLTRAAIGYLVIYAVLVAVVAALSWNSLGPLVAWYAQTVQSMLQGGEGSAPPPQVLALTPYLGLLSLLSLVLFAAFEAACLRWLVRGESGGGLLGLTFGADTWRVLATYFVWLGLFIAFAILVAVFYALCVVVANMGGPARLVALLLGALAPLGFIALMIWGGVRFAPAAANSIARRRFAFFEAPRITRGRFWELLGSFVILIIGYIVVSMIGETVLGLPAQSAMAPVTREIMTGEADSVWPLLVDAMRSPIFLGSAV